MGISNEDMIDKASPERATRRRVIVRAGQSAAIAGLIGGVGLSAQRAMAQQATPVPPTGGAVLTGSWVVSVNFDGSTPLTLPNLVSFAADGTMTVAAPPLLPELPGAGSTQDAFSGGIGAWTQTGDGNAEARFAFLVTSADGTLASVNTVRQSIALEPSGDVYNGTFTLDIADAAGTISSTATGKIQGNRILVGPTGPITVPGEVMTIS
jgi:hypothetical protein